MAPLLTAEIFFGSWMCVGLLKLLIFGILCSAIVLSPDVRLLNTRPSAKVFIRNWDKTLCDGELLDYRTMITLIISGLGDMNLHWRLKAMLETFLKNSYSNTYIDRYNLVFCTSFLFSLSCVVFRVYCAAAFWQRYFTHSIELNWIYRRTYDHKIAVCFSRIWIVTMLATRALSMTVLDG